MVKHSLEYDIKKALQGFVGEPNNSSIRQEVLETVAHIMDDHTQMRIVPKIHIDVEKVNRTLIVKYRIKPGKFKLVNITPV